MKEFLEIYSVEGESLGTIEKKEAHRRMREEYREHGRVSIRHKHVRLILMTSNGRVILQRRSKWKGDNPGMWDKTIGGHVTAGDGYDLTILKECAEELGIPATVVPEQDFDHAASTTDLHVLGVITKLTHLDNYQSSRSTKDGKWVEPSKTQFYIGYYDGAIRFIDQESCGIQVFTKEELQHEMREHPETFTDDMHSIMQKFGDRIRPAPERREHELND